LKIIDTHCDALYKMQLEKALVPILMASIDPWII